MSRDGIVVSRDIQELVLHADNEKALGENRAVCHMLLL